MTYNSTSHQDRVRTGRIRRSTTNNALNLAVDIRRVRPWKVVVLIAFAALWGGGVASIPTRNPDSAPSAVSQEAVVRPIESGGAEVETVYYWATAYAEVTMSLRLGDQEISNLTGGTPAGPATFESLPGNEYQEYFVRFPMPDQAPVRGGLSYTVGAPVGDTRIDVVVQPNQLSAVDGDFDDRSLFRARVVGFELSNVECQILGGDRDSASPCELTESAPGEYEVEAPGYQGRPIRIGADRGAAVAGNFDGPLDEPVSSSLQISDSNAFVYSVAAAFAILTGLWVLWAVRRGSNDYLDASGRVRRVTDGYLYRQATPTFQVPEGVAPYQGRALANERITRMVALTHVADLICQDALHGTVDRDGAVTITRGENYGAASVFDQVQIGRLLEPGDPRTLKRRSRRFTKRIAELNGGLAEHIAVLDWWRHGNPAYRRPAAFSALGLIAGLVAWLGSLVALMMYVQGPLRTILTLGWGAMFVMGVGYSFVIFRILPSLTTHGSRHLVEIESLRQGLERVTDQQLLAFAAQGQLGEYAAWSVALNVAHVDNRLQNLANQYPTDQRILTALATSKCVRNRARSAAGMSAFERLIGYRFFYHPNGTGRDV